MSNAISEIVRYQTDRTLDKQDYNPMNEHANIFEELLESIGMDVSKENRPKLKANLDLFVSNLAVNEVVEVGSTTTGEKADAYVDVIVFAVGALLKLGFDPEKALIEGGKEINSRIGTIIDGKFEKDLSDEAKQNWYKADYKKARL